MQSASSSKTKCPSGRCASRSARRAREIAVLDLGERDAGRRIFARRTSFVLESRHSWRAPFACGSSRPRDSRTGPRLRSSRAGPSPSSRRPASDWRSPSRGPGRRAFSSGVAAKVARFSLMICHGGSGLIKIERLRHFGPNSRRQLLAPVVEQPIGAADRDRDPVREGEQPFDHPVDDAENGGLAGGGAILK